MLGSMSTGSRRGSSLRRCWQPPRCRGILWTPAVAGGDAALRASPWQLPLRLFCQRSPLLTGTISPPQRSVSCMNGLHTAAGLLEGGLAPAALLEAALAALLEATLAAGLLAVLNAVLLEAALVAMLLAVLAAAPAVPPLLLLLLPPALLQLDRVHRQQPLSKYLQRRGMFVVAAGRAAPKQGRGHGHEEGSRASARPPVVAALHGDAVAAVDAVGGGGGTLLPRGAGCRRADCCCRLRQCSANGLHRAAGAADGLPAGGVEDTAHNCTDNVAQDGHKSACKLILRQSRQNQQGWSLGPGPPAHSPHTTPTHPPTHQKQTPHIHLWLHQ